MANPERITRLVHKAAAQAAPGDLDLWPAIRARLQPQAARAPRRKKGTLTLAAALMIAITAGLVLALHGDRERGPVHTSSLHQTTDPRIAPAAYLPTPTPTQEFCKAYASFGEEKTLYREPDANSRAVYEPIPAGSPLIVWDSQEIDGETWYDVTLYYFSVDFRGWVQGEPTELYECRDYPAAYPGIRGSGIYATLITYTSPTLGIAVQVPGGWTPYEDATLNRPDQQISSLSFFESAEDAGPFDPENLPIHGSAIIVINSQDRSVFATDNQAGDLNNAEDILGQLLGHTPVLDGVRLLPYLVDHGDNGMVLYLLLVPPDGNIRALYEALLKPMLKASGVPMIDITNVNATDFSDQGVYTHASALTTDNPQHGYFIPVKAMPTAPLKQADRYVIFSVAGTDYTPNLSVSALLTGQYAGYRTNDGAVLTGWYDAAGQANDHPSYLVNVEGNLSTMPGDYTFSVRPITDIVDLSKGPQHVSLGYRTPQVVRYTPNGSEPVRLNIAVGQWMEASGVPSPDVAVILPDGVTLARFNPGQTQQLNLTFTPPADSAPLILFYPLDTAPTEHRNEIAMFVSSGETASGNTATPGTATPLEGTILLPEGTVAVSIPQSGYVIMQGDAASLVGQTVSVAVSFLFVNVDAETQALAGAITLLPDALAPNGEAVQQVTQTVIDSARVVSAGPYLAPFSSDSPDLHWATGQEAWGAITLAVTPQDATVLQWAVEAKIPVILSLAK